MEKTVFIQNLKCGGCAHTVTTKLSALEGVSEVSVDVEKSSVTFSGGEGVFELVKNKLVDLGYPMEGEKNSVLSKTKSFVSCAVGKATK